MSSFINHIQLSYCHPVALSSQASFCKLLHFSNLEKQVSEFCLEYPLPKFSSKENPYVVIAVNYGGVKICRKNVAECGGLVPKPWGVLVSPCGTKEVWSTFGKK